MKLFKHIAGLLSATAIAVGAWSCTDLDEVTFDRIDASTYYQDEQSVQSAVASIYASAASGFSASFRFSRSWDMRIVIYVLLKNPFCPCSA